MGLIKQIAKAVAERLADDALPTRQAGRCPQCGAGPSKREDASPFGPVRTIVCGVCGYDFSAEAQS